MPQAATLYPLPLRFNQQSQSHSELASLIEECRRLAESEPKILVRIDQDRDRNAKIKKARRIADAHWLAGGESLFGSEFCQVGPVPLELLQGRPRIPSLVVMVFSMIRGWLGGVKDGKTYSLILEAVSVEALLAEFGLEYVGRSTIVENCNQVGIDTLQFIFEAAIRMAKDEGLDDYKMGTFDSTAVDSCSAFPTDSDLIAKLIFRARHGFGLLRKAGFTVAFTSGTEMRIEEVGNLAKEIVLVGGKGKKRKRNKAYNLLYRKAMASRTYLLRGLDRAIEERKKTDGIPSKLARVDMVLASIKEDLERLEKVVESSKLRTKHCANMPADKKVYSVSDPDAAMIVKGGREPTFGYRPQIGRSQKGMITAFSVEAGNTADAPQLVPIVKAHIASTGVVPEAVAFDDGYSSAKGIKKCKEIKGIERVSIGGAKGRKIIPKELYDSEEYRELRGFRSTAESTIGHLKGTHQFGQCARFGLDAVKHEMLEKIICFNLRKITFLRIEKEKRAFRA